MGSIGTVRLEWKLSIMGEIQCVTVIKGIVDVDGESSRVAVVWVNELRKRW